ncbi:DUF397 domain-containing protein [Actinokineospora auranticolor]|uniref:Uncharacterized protein DUF397 n=1 Tax=Actinokineospora auranticolor TaxID=155976 RepID=A0A2S6GBP3_9PSEU|nr:DUF397 domain-containing protein [Actinokineospora auranticolor]PPK61353.1 uncharacterized protein DUF397 [Actinokineospora auranticolor]
MVARFRRSSRCNTGGCVELGYDARALLVRDTVLGDVIEVRGARARAVFVDSLRRGRFDLG